ncbi:phospholipase D family protein [Ramlibacter sp. AW1]|uniref:Phospholipase D family protein n=1 Tax=Ramlibacter aurantiacus TaxID=2801330 RepID=A0A936ZN52_9BURK|nr:phospholipase D family protein [Ramlibacter aurantiacus]MBL0423238.1 phospholipase D family protein [Ramlibacter aurantiacus]
MNAVVAPPDKPPAHRRAVLVLLTMVVALFGCASLPPSAERPVSHAFSKPDEAPLGRLAHARAAREEARIANGFHLLDTAELGLSSRLALIREARHSLDLQYYAIHVDSSSSLLLLRLREAAARGVRVRLLLDDFQAAGSDAEVLQLALEPGIEVRLFNPLGGPRASFLGRIVGSLHDWERIQRRMHNKLFIADSAWGIVGGRNLGDAYFGAADASNFIDLDVLATGRIVHDMAASFDRYWNDPLAYPVQSLVSPRELESLRQPQAAPADSSPLAPEATTTATFGKPAAPERQPLDLARVPLTWAPSLLMVDRPEKITEEPGDPAAGESVVEGLLSLMRQARKEVLIVSPYFVPGREMKQTFDELRRRGVAVRVLTNSLASTDAPAAHAGYARHRVDLLRRGVELHEMRAEPSSSLGLEARDVHTGSSGRTSRSSLHLKAVVIDGRSVVIGSMNLDLRSQLQNSEVALLIRSSHLAERLVRLFHATLARSAWRVQLRAGGHPRWIAPSGAPFADSDQEPEAGLGRRWLVRILGPFAPDELL